jgi:hypothetical protein
MRMHMAHQEDDKFTICMQSCAAHETRSDQEAETNDYTSMARVYCRPHRTTQRQPVPLVSMSCLCERVKKETRTLNKIKGQTRNILGACHEFCVKVNVRRDTRDTLYTLRPSKERPCPREGLPPSPEAAAFSTAPVEVPYALLEVKTAKDRCVVLVCTSRLMCLVLFAVSLR